MAKTLTIIGAGPKALAIAAKARALRVHGYLVPDIVIIEKNEVAANWTGKYGLTDGNQVLGTPAEKDVGFPYASKEFPRDIDVYVLNNFSWLAFNIHRWAGHPDALDAYGESVDRGLKGQPVHSQWADYLKWVDKQVRSSVKMVTGTVTSISVTENERWSIDVRTRNSQMTIESDGLVVTGPGPARRIPGQPESHKRVFDGRTFWLHLNAFSDLALDDEPIGVVGSGETAASVVAALAQTLKHPVPIFIVNRQGAIFSRGEGYWENHLYTAPEEEWDHLPLEDRRAIISRTDRGVFSLEKMTFINQLRNVFHKRMDVMGIEIVTQYEHEPEGRPVILGRSGLRLPTQYVIGAAGFDPWWFVGLIRDQNLRDLMTHEQRRELLIEHVESDLSFARDWVASPKLHVPMLAGLRQGPGFPNLSCLGLLSDRILAPYVQRQTASAG